MPASLISSRPGGRGTGPCFARLTAIRELGGPVLEAALAVRSVGLFLATRRAPSPDRVLGGAKLQRREDRDIHRKPGRHSDADLDQPVCDIVRRLVTAEQEHEQSGECDLSTLITQPPPAAEQDAAKHDDGNARNTRSQQHPGWAQLAPRPARTRRRTGGPREKTRPPWIDTQQRGQRREVSGLGRSDAFVRLSQRSRFRSNQWSAYCSVLNASTSTNLAVS
jgi:hypothetical protein